MLRAFSLRFRRDNPATSSCPSGNQNAREHLDRRRLAGAVGADVADQFAGIERIVTSSTATRSSYSREKSVLESPEPPGARLTVRKTLRRSRSDIGEPSRAETFQVGFCEVSSAVIVTISNQYGAGSGWSAARAASPPSCWVTVRGPPVAGVVAKRLTSRVEAVEESKTLTPRRAAPSSKGLERRRRRSAT